MMLRTIAAAALFLPPAAMAADAARADAGAAGVLVEIRLAEPGALAVRYQLPPGCDRLPFEENGAAGAEARASWTAADQCGKATADGLARTDSSCASLRFRVPAAATFRGYPPAFPMGEDEGIYLHTSHYAPTAACGAVRYRLAAPGSVVVAAQAHEDHASLEGGTAGDTPVLLLRQPLQPVDGRLRYFDHRLSAAARAQISQVADGTADYLRQRLPGVPYTPPMLTAAMASAPGGPNVSGNGGDLTRLVFFNWPEQPGEDERHQMTLLVAHEMSHRFQLRDAVDNYPAARLIHEGGAEFMRWMASVGNGWMTPAQAAAELDDALARCMVGTDGSSWGALTPRYIQGNTLEYACGLPAYVYALAARQGKGTVWSRLDAFYGALRQGRQPDFGSSLECGAAPSCAPRWLPALTGSDGSMAEQWRRLFQETGLAQPREPSRQTRKEILLKAVGQLMEDDCGGHKSIMPTPDGILLFGRGECRTLRANADLLRVEDMALTDYPQALAAMTAACRQRQAVRFALKDGSALRLPCQRPYRGPEQFFGADIGKVLARLTSG